MKTFIIAAMAAIFFMSCTQYKVKRTGTSSPVVITDELDKGYKVGDTVTCHFTGRLIKHTCVIVDVINNP